MKLSILRHNMAIVCTGGLSPCALGNTPALSIDRCLLWSYTEVMKKEKMITEPSPGQGGTIGEVNAILRTATECSAWTNASDSYINSQAMYAADRLNQYGKLNNISNNVVHNLNKAFMGHCMFELNNNQIIVGQSLGGCTVKGRKR